MVINFNHHSLTCIKVYRLRAEELGVLLIMIVKQEHFQKKIIGNKKHIQR